MNRKTMLKLISVLLSVLLLCGCAAPAAPTETTAPVETVPAQTTAPETTAPETTVPETTAVITLTDQAGRTITLDQPARSIVSCYYITTYATMALGISDRVVGLEKKADTRPIYHMAAPALLEKPAVGTLKQFDVEAAAALAPDLVLMPKKLMEHADMLTDLGIAVLVVNPESQEAMEQMLHLIAEACGVPERAEALTAYYQERQAEIASLVKDQETPSVYMAGNSSYLSTAPGKMYQSGLIAMAGGRNVAQELDGDYWTEVSYETILSYDPEVILIPGKADYTVKDILNDENLAGVTAVENKAVYKIPASLEEWDSPIPSGILGAMWMTSVLHGDVYPFEQFRADAAAYYKTFYGFDLDKTLITK